MFTVPSNNITFMAWILKQDRISLGVLQMDVQVLAIQWGK